MSVMTPCHNMSCIVMSSSQLFRLICIVKKATLCPYWLVLTDLYHCTALIVSVQKSIHRNFTCNRWSLLQSMSADQSEPNQGGIEVWNART